MGRKVSPAVAGVLSTYASAKAAGYLRKKSVERKLKKEKKMGKSKMKEELRGWVENQMDEGYQVITTLQPQDAFKQYGFWLDPAEYRIVEGVKHYRVIKPSSKKGGWRPGYAMESIELPDSAVNSIRNQN